MFRPVTRKRRPATPRSGGVFSPLTPSSRRTVSSGPTAGSAWPPALIRRRTHWLPSRQGRLAEADAVAVEQHPCDCPSRRRWLDRAAATCLRPLRGLASRGTLAAGGTTGETAFPAGQQGTASDNLPAALADHDRYQVLQVLGHGGLGTVCLTQHGGRNGKTQSS